MATHFTSDHHFNHARVIEYEQRPFANVEEMNEELIRRYNERVYPGDIVYLVGDVFFGHHEETNLAITRRLNGEKFLVRGNHDRATVTRLKRWGFRDVVPSVVIYINQYRCLLRHNPLQPGDSRKVGEDYDFLIHGHTHGPVKKEGFNLHVGVDAWNYYPVRESELVRLIEGDA